MNADFVALIGAAERIEAEVFADEHEAAQPPAADACGLALPSGWPLVAVAGKLDVLMYNRVVGLGLDEPATPERLDEIVDAYGDAGVSRFMVQLAPGAMPPDLIEWLAARGFYHHNDWLRLWRDMARPIVDAPTELRIEAVRPGRAGELSRIVCSQFNWPARLEPVVAALVGRPGWRFYGAFEGDTPVASAALCTRDELGWIGYAATLPEHRGRGAQSALLARRLRDARDAGCRRLFAEAADPRPERPNPSVHNMRRFGFELGYLRPNWVLTYG